ncbi:MAG: PIN domain-containing protein [Rubrobacteraceae bacterium]
MTIVLDTSGLLAAVDADQRFHPAAREALERSRTDLVLSPFVLAELDYMVLTRVGRAQELSLLDEVAKGAYRLDPFSAKDVAEAGKLIREYSDLDIGLADASNVVLADRHETLDILTLDEWHFRPLRSGSGRPFRLLPFDA